MHISGVGVGSESTTSHRGAGRCRGLFRDKHFRIRIKNNITEAYLGDKLLSMD